MGFGVWLPHLHFNGYELPAYTQDQELTDDDVLRDVFRPRYRSADKMLIGMMI